MNKEEFQKALRIRKLRISNMEDVLKFERKMLKKLLEKNAKHIADCNI